MPIIPVVDYPWVPVLFEDDDASWGGKYWGLRISETLAT
jgi:hypothetical protein